MHVTLREIAGIAGVHFVTVSRALRDDRSLPEETRRRIQALAREMGYEPKPLLSALSSYRRQKGSKHVTLAFVTNWPPGHDPHLSWGQGQYFPAAKSRASEFGYRLEEFRLTGDGMSLARLGEVLRARGVPGVIVQDSPHTTGADFAGFRWEWFSVCLLGYIPHELDFPRVAHFPFHSMQLAMRTLAGRRFRRVALALEPWQDERVDAQWTAAYRSECHRLGQSATRLLWLRPQEEMAAFLAWLEKTRPDAILTYGIGARHDCWESAGKPGGEFPWFFLNRRSGRPGFSGIDQNLETVGRKAVDVVTSHIARREAGPIDVRITTMVEGHWYDPA